MTSLPSVASLSEDAPVLLETYYVRLVLPSGDFAMLPAQDTTTFGDLFYVLEKKKNLIIGNDVDPYVLDSNGERFKADQEQELAEFDDIKEIYVVGEVKQSTPVVKPARRSSVMNAPQAKKTSIRANSESFFPPANLGDSSPTPGTPKTASRMKNIKAAFTGLFGGKKLEEVNEAASSLSNSVSVSSQMGKRVSDLTASGDSATKRKETNTLSTSPSASLSLVSQSAIAKAAAELAQSMRESQSFEKLATWEPSSNSAPSPSFLRKANVLSPLSPLSEDNQILSSDSSSELSADRNTLAPSSPCNDSMMKDEMNDDASSVYKNESTASRPESSVSKRRSPLEPIRPDSLSSNSAEQLAASFAIPPAIGYLSVNEDISKALDSLSINRSDSSEGLGFLSSSLSKSPRKPQKIDTVATLKRNILLETRPQSPSPIVSPNDGSKSYIIKLSILDQGNTTIKMPPDITMEDMCLQLCGRRGLDPELHTFELENTPVEMDRPLRHYAKEDKVMDLALVRKSKTYSTMTIDEEGEDVLIFQIVKGQRQVMASTVEKIFEILTDATNPDEKFLDMVLLTFRSFISPEDFFDQLISRFFCELPPDPTPEDVEYFNKHRIPTQRRVLFVLQWWVEHHWHDFGLSTEFRSALESFIEDALMYETGLFLDEAKDILAVTDRQKATFDELLVTYSIGERRGKALDSMFIDLEPIDMAQQLCIHNYNIFKNIHPIEFLNEIWKKDNDSSPSFKFFVERFDKESYWVATELLRVKDIKKRAVVLKKFIYLAKCSVELNNFFSTFALIAGLNLTPVQRLKKTWEVLNDKTKKIWAEVEKIGDPSRNMKNYRDRLALSTSPMVPFLPIYLKDLTFINDGNPGKIRGLINVDKLRMMANRVIEIKSLASKPYPFEHKPPILNYLAKPPIEKDMSKLKQMAVELEK